MPGTWLPTNISIPWRYSLDNTQVLTRVSMKVYVCHVVTEDAHNFQQQSLQA